MMTDEAGRRRLDWRRSLPEGRRRHGAGKEMAMMTDEAGRRRLDWRRSLPEGRRRHGAGKEMGR